ncbi:AMP-binding enzyme [Popillia japonica]|uniref:AMP-binding enzyme n=1 Tax=Popillia japonica TaxID=7064 RepID=A0AAW1KRQ9_POPJA
MHKLINLRAARNVEKFTGISTIFVRNKYEYKRQPQTNSARHYINNDIITSSLGNVKVPNENLVEHVWKNYEKWGDNPAATCAVSGRSYSYSMMRMMIDRCAKALIAHCAMKPREVVGLLLPNIPEYIAACHGAIQAGLIVTFVNPLYTPDEIKRQFENAGVKMIMTIPLLLEVAVTLGKYLPGYKTTVCIGGDDDITNNVNGFQSLLMADYQSDLPGINPHEMAILPYSSGTTGLPKGVMLSHRNLVANLVQLKHPALLKETDMEETQEVALTVLPFFHIYGFNGILNVCLKEGIHLVTIPKFTPEDYVKALEEYRPAYLFVVPSLLLFLASHPGITKEHLQSVKDVTSGAASATEGVLQKFRQKIEKDDIIIRQGYGMTESAPVTLFMPLLTPPSKIGTVGILPPSTEAKIVDLTTGETLSDHKPGELCIRGPQVMNGYLNNERATAETIDEDGWLHTGDVAYYDGDKYFYIVDRCKELIKVKGNQVGLIKF